MPREGDPQHRLLRLNEIHGRISRLARLGLSEPNDLASLRQSLDRGQHLVGVCLALEGFRNVTKQMPLLDDSLGLRGSHDTRQCELRKADIMDQPFAFTYDPDPLAFDASDLEQGLRSPAGAIEFPCPPFLKSRQGDIFVFRDPCLKRCNLSSTPVLGSVKAARRCRFLDLGTSLRKDFEYLRGNTRDLEVSALPNNLDTKLFAELAREFTAKQSRNATRMAQDVPIVYAACFSVLPDT